MTVATGMRSAISEKIVVGIDFEEPGYRALHAAIRLASTFGNTEIHAVHVRPVLEGVTRRDVAHSEADIDRLRVYVRDRLTEHEREYGAGTAVPIEVHRATGSPAAEIERLAASLGAGLIVVGTHGRKGIKHAVFGSIAEDVVRAATCPVLVMRPAAHPATDRLRDAVDPVCAECSARRAETQGAELWCASHSEHRPPPRTAPRAPWGVA